MRVQLICNKNAGPGKETITTTGDSDVVLTYVSEWAESFSLLIGI